MSLLKCPECGKEVSEYAECCPNCGCPILLIKKKEVVEGYCNINGVLCSKEDIETMIHEDTIYKFLLHECKLSGGDALSFKRVIKFNNNEIPDNFYECYERMITALKAKTEREAVHCKYCGSTNVKKLRDSFYNFGNQWHCNNCDSDF